MNALEPTNGVPGVITSTGFAEVSTRPDGSFTIQAGSGRHRVTISAPGFVPRETGIVIPGRHAEISLIPSSFDLATFDQMARPRSFGGLVRWVSAPSLVFHARLLDCTHEDHRFVTALSQTISEHARADAVSALREALNVFSGGALADFSSVTVFESQPGETTLLPDDKWPRSIHAGECSAFRRGGSGTGGLLHMIGYVPTQGYALWRTDLTGLGRRYAQQHELGHALGLWHPSTGQSIMRIGFPTLTAFDHDAGRLIFQRPPGNRTPDVDPEGYAVNDSQ